MPYFPLSPAPPPVYPTGTTKIFTNIAIKNIKKTNFYFFKKTKQFLFFIFLGEIFFCSVCRREKITEDRANR